MNNKIIFSNEDIKPNSHSKRNKKLNISLPILEVSNNQYHSIIHSKWFNEDFYSFIRKHNYSVVILNIDTGQRTVIHTFGARFPMELCEVA
ncbi:hypothetical protein [Bacillus toyonensis]|uniref:hypothetical protein n=1 Tax=Bacillus toyonensis TaxID=155322 RepID=UPI002E1F962C|nr:hypothetical protein [Bacillus toyonensis]